MITSKNTVTVAALVAVGAAGIFAGLNRGETNGRVKYAGEHTPFTLDALRKTHGNVTTDAIVRFDPKASTILTPGKEVRTLPNGHLSTNWGTANLMFTVTSATDPDMKPLTCSQTFSVGSPDEWKMINSKFEHLFPDSGSHAILKGRYWREAYTPAGGGPDGSTVYGSSEGFKISSFELIEARASR